MPTFDELLTAYKQLLPLIYTGGAALSVVAVGLVPRIGPGRAAWIALSSRFAIKPVPECIRFEEIKLLKSKIAEKNFGQGYLVVIGEKGVGKSCLLNTVTSKTTGVIKVEAKPQHSQDDIVLNTLKELTRMQHFISPRQSAKRVVFWHRFFTFGRSPIIVIKVTEREAGDGYAGLTGAVRTLVDEFSLRVVVDGSPNSLPESLFRTTREEVFHIKPMTKEMIYRLEQYQELFSYIKEAEMDDIVFAVLGGIPSLYEKLWRDTKTGLQNGQNARQVIGTLLCAQIYAAIKVVEDFCNDDKPSVVKLTELFQDTTVFRKTTLRVNNIHRPTPDKVFCEIKQNNITVLIPASNAIEIVLRHKLTSQPSLNELEELVKAIKH